jgi:histidine ammonia-lyase
MKLKYSMPENNRPVHYISHDELSLETLAQIISDNKQILLSEQSIEAIRKCRAFLEDKLENSDSLLYGINTGFGALCDIRISRKDLQQLQVNLIRSHACGLGDRVPDEIVKLMLLLKIQSLSYGYSGIRLETVQRLVDFYNLGLLPVVYTKGSLGASGDLAPLAHLCLPLIGEGEITIEGNIYPASEALKMKKLSTIELGAKEGLALLNGTQFMSAYGAWCLLESQRLSAFADIVAALSTDVFSCKTEPFLPYIHNIRPHKGQIAVAQNILNLLENSEIASSAKQQTQDQYAFRCIPQVHGASNDAIAHIRQVFETEVNSVTDNPNVFPDEGMILSGGNFHGQPLAIGFDYLCIALAELGSISERRTYNLISGKRGLPEFLVANPGLNSGLMIAQYSAAAMVSENKQLCTPASVDSIPSSNGQEDHVSMGANGAIKAYRVVKNLENILAIEWLNATQALDFRRPLKTSPFLEKLVSVYRTKVSFMEHDRIISQDIMATVKWMQSQSADLSQ